MIEQVVVQLWNTIGQFWYLLPLLFLVWIFKSSWFKGKFGEFTVNVIAARHLDKEKYHLIKDVTLPTTDGSTQIDHIVVSIYGVFVVETKNMKGWIFGGARQRTWTQTLFRSSYKFQNPLHQNFKHVKTLQSLLGLSEDQIHSVVVFIGDSTFKTEMPENVTSGGGYIRFIESKTEPVLSEDKVEEIKHEIERGRYQRSFKTNREHTRHAKQIKRTKRPGR